MPPGRPSAGLPPVVPRRPPRGNGLGPIAAFCGLVGLALGIVLPWFVFLVLVTAGAGLVMGGATFRHAVVTGAPGRWLGLTGLLTGGVGLVLMFLGLAETRDDMRDQAQGLGSLFGDMDTLAVAADVRGVTFPGTGTARVALEDVVLDVELVGCGLANPAPGIALGGHGFVSEPRYASIAFTSSTLGTPTQVLTVDLGSDTWVLRPVESGGQLFAVQGDTVSASGSFRPVGGGQAVEGTFTATCTG